MIADRRETILVVKAGAVIAPLVRALRPSYRVTCATNGAEALLAAQDRPQPSLILLGGDTADIDGHEVCRRLKAEEATWDIPVVVLGEAGDDAEDDEELAYCLGAVDFMKKPCHPAIVARRVDIQMARRRVTQPPQAPVTAEVDRCLVQLKQTMHGVDGVAPELAAISQAVDIQDYRVALSMLQALAVRLGIPLEDGA